MRITIVGLGPSRADIITREAWEVLSSADEIYLRTRQHPAVAEFPSSWKLHSFDYLYESHESFSAVYDAIVHKVLELGRRTHGVVYAVPGSPYVGESTTAEIVRLAKDAGIPVRIITGVSFLEPLFGLLGIDPVDGAQVYDAMLLAQDRFPVLLPEYPVVVAQCYSRALAGDVKLTLMAMYPDDHLVSIVRNVGTPDASVETVPLFELDRHTGFDHMTSLYLPPLPHAGAYESLQKIAARLRAPDGCPWDKEQTHLSLRPNLLEEAYEVLDALDAENPTKLQEELGDLLLQVAMHVQIASEEGDFKLPDVVGGIVEKLIRRHPHVFGDIAVSGVEEVLENWEKIKRAEREKAGEARRSFLDGVPGALPALAQAQAYVTRARRRNLPVGAVLSDADIAGLLGDSSAERLGEVLWAMAAWADARGIDAESALRETNARHKARLSDLDAASLHVA